MKQCANCMIVKANEHFRVLTSEGLSTKCSACEAATGKTPNEE